MSKFKFIDKAAENSEAIEVRLKVKDMPLHDGPEKYFYWLDEKLKEAGIPVDGDNLLRGTLHRFDDPEDFGSTIYRWEPNQ